MDLNTIEIQIFVSCPKDVNKEKGSVKNICDVVNKDLLQSGENIRFIFRDFSEIIGHAGERPQEIINQHITGYNIYLGILFMRFGTRTGAINLHTGKEYESGTEEEFIIASEKKISGEQPGDIYFFFKKQKGCTSVEENDQAGKVLKFKNRLGVNNWVNSFNTTYEFESTVRSLLTRSSINIIRNKKMEVKQTVIDKSISSTLDDIKIDVSAFVPTLPYLAYYIPRSISSFKNNDLSPNLFREEREIIFLRDIIQKEKRIAILGNAGSGKSVELQQAAQYFLGNQTPYIPVYKRFNTYTNEDIKEFLPEGWDSISPEIMLLLLDGLDEIQPQYFNTAISKIIDFSERHPNLHIVISCRTNFYELPTETFSGTLTGFQVYILNDISLAEIQNYTTAHFDIDGQIFIRDAHAHSFLDLIQKPFFLNILLRHYKEKGSFSDGRAKIIEEFILSRIDLDKDHFKSTINSSKKSILALLEKVAFVMEVMGKNFISDEELETVLTKPEDLQQIKYFTAFTKNLQNNQWMFEHNNIQEFLASQVLNKQSFNKLIKTISFPPAFNKVKPTWVNTLSFFISTGNPNLIDKLVSWLVEKEKEILVKFEPDRITITLREQIFKQIFNSYKEKNIWLSSNKFSYNELASFASSPATINFLIDQIQDKTNTRTVRMNAISVLENIDLNHYDPDYKEQIKNIFRNILNDETPDSNTIHYILYAMAKLEITDYETIEAVVKKYSKRKNQYVRSAMYKLINASSYLDKYVTIFLDGLALSEIEEAIEDRESVNLMDESWNLKEGLSNIKSPGALKTIFSFFKDPLERRKLSIYDYKDLFRQLLDNAGIAYTEDSSLYSEVYDIYITAGRTYDHELAKDIVSFFKGIDRISDTFNMIWHDKSIKDYEKNFLLELLYDKSVLDKFLEGYRNRDFTNEDAVKMQHLLLYGFDQEALVIEQYENIITEISGFIMERPRIKDWKAINMKKTQEGFDILFRPRDLLEEIRSIFSEIGDELAYEDLWELRKVNHKELDDYFNLSALELIRDFTTGGKKVILKDLESWIETNPSFGDYQVNEIYQQLHGSRSSSLIVSKEQADFIETWCRNISLEIEIPNAVRIDERNSVFINNKVTWLWFFIRHFNIIIEENKLLDFTLFYDPTKQHKENEKGTIDEIEQLVSKSKIQKKVIANLSNNIPVIDVWANNVTYALNNSIRKAFPYILRDIKDATKSEYRRLPLLQMYFKQTGNLEALEDLLKSITTDLLRWGIVKILIDFPAKYSFLQSYLIKILQNEYELHERRMEAAKFLIQINDIRGLEFTANLIIKNQDPQFEFRRWLGTLSNLKNIDAIPILLRLLKIAKQPEFLKDNFNRLDSVISDALYNIAVQSEENFILIKKSVETFIKANMNIQDINYLHFNIQRMEEQLYLKKSQEYSIDDAIQQFNQLTNV